MKVIIPESDAWHRPIDNLKTDVVPIIFMRGTGGNFLAYWLRYAKLVDSKQLIPEWLHPKFTERGSAHKMARYQSPCADPNGCDLEYHLDFIQSWPVRTEEGNPAFFAVDSPPSVAEFADKFDKFIYLGYEADDVKEICQVFFGKRFLDGIYIPDADGNFSDKGQFTLDPNDSDDLVQLREHFTLFYTLAAKYQSGYEIASYENGLCVSWKEFTRSSPEYIIDQVSKFLGYDPSSFDSDSLAEWQRLTVECAAELQLLIDTLMGK